MATKNESNIRVAIVVIAMIALVATLAGALYGVGILAPNNEGEGFFANLQYGVERWAENPILISIIATTVINFFGYLENAVITPSEKYEVVKYIETILVYEPLLILFMQAMEMKYALILAVTIDVLRRLVAHRKKS